MGFPYRFKSGRSHQQRNLFCLPDKRGFFNIIRSLRGISLKNALLDDIILTSEVVVLCSEQFMVMLLAHTTRFTTPKTMILNLTMTVFYRCQRTDCSCLQSNTKQFIGHNKAGHPCSRQRICRTISPVLFLSSLCWIWQHVCRLGKEPLCEKRPQLWKRRIYACHPYWICLRHLGTSSFAGKIQLLTNTQSP